MYTHCSLLYTVQHVQKCDETFGWCFFLLLVFSVVQDHAEQSGEKQKVESLKKELEELEERAEELDKQRSRGLSAIR